MTFTFQGQSNFSWRWWAIKHQQSDWLWRTNLRTHPQRPSPDNPWTHRHCWNQCQDIWTENLNWLRHYEHTSAHMFLKTTDFVTNNRIIVPHPPYSPNLAPCDFLLFSKLKMKPKRRRFETMSHIQSVLQATLDSIKENDFHGACWSLYSVYFGRIRQPKLSK
jgi:hypothetical protein